MARQPQPPTSESLPLLRATNSQTLLGEEWKSMRFSLTVNVERLIEDAVSAAVVDDASAPLSHEGGREEKQRSGGSEQQKHADLAAAGVD